MSGKLFTPNFDQMPLEEAESVVTESVRKSSFSRVLRTIVIIFFGLLPIFFTPHLWASLGFDKILLSLAASVITVVGVSFVALRKSTVKTVLPLSLVFFGLVVVSALVASFLTADPGNAIRGSFLETQTAGFLVIMGLIMLLPLVFQNHKDASLKALVLFSVTASSVLVYNILRLFIGSDFLSWQSFGTVTVSPIGNFNDLAIFCGLVIVFSLITLLRLPLKNWLQGFISGLILLAIILLMVINFFNVWIILGFFSLVSLVYLGAKDKLFKNTVEGQVKKNVIAIITTTAVFVVSLLFIVAGDYFGAKVNNLTEVNYIEVRPSIEATVDIARAVYQESPLFGVGPNNFATAWRQYKDPTIAETIFWDTEFNAGGSFVLTHFVNNGLVGGFLLIFSHLLFLYLGYKMLLRTKQHDSYWYYLGVVSFTSACFVGVLSYVYTVGPTILLIGAFFTGLTFVSAGALLPKMVYSVPLVTSQRKGFLMMAVTILIFSIGVATIYSVGKQYVAQVNFSKADNSAVSREIKVATAEKSYQMYKDDRFIAALAQLKFEQLNGIFSIQEPTEEDKIRFSETSNAALSFAQEAVLLAPENPSNYVIGAGVYSILALTGIEGAQERVEESLVKAQEIDPLNPSYHLIAAQLAVRTGNLENARIEIDKALVIKRNYTEALYLSAQLDVNEGETDSAVETTKAIISLEPNNPARYFQLGVLQSTANPPEAKLAFRAAIEIDPQYANARYLLALIYLEEGHYQLALEQLRVVELTNPNNLELTQLISKVEAGDYVVPDNDFSVPVSERAPQTDFENIVTTQSDTETDLVTSVNTIAEEPEVVENIDLSEDSAKVESSAAVQEEL